MKKFLIVLFITISVFSVTAQKTIFKINYTHNIFGLDFGYVNDNSIYQYIGFSPILDKKLPAYFNYGCGYVFDSSFYAMGLIGIVVPPTMETNIIYRNTDYLNIGAETGFMYKDFVVGFFYTNTVGAGIKLGYSFKFE